MPTPRLRSGRMFSICGSARSAGARFSSAFEKMDSTSACSSAELNSYLDSVSASASHSRFENAKTMTGL
jgi:hypothetical protein